MYIQGSGCQKCFPVIPPAATTFPPPEDPNPGQNPDTMEFPSCPWASIYPQMPGRCYNPEQVSVCQIHGKTYWTGTIMQRNEITDQLDSLAEVVLQNRRGLDLLTAEKGGLSLFFGEGNGTPLQCSCLSDHGVAKSRARLSDFTFTFHFHTLEKEMATHSSVLAWRIPGMVEPDGLPSMGSHRVGHD